MAETLGARAPSVPCVEGEAWAPPVHLCGAGGPHTAPALQPSWPARAWLPDTLRSDKQHLCWVRSCIREGRGRGCHRGDQEPPHPHWALVVGGQGVGQAPAPARAWRPLPVDCGFGGQPFVFLQGRTLKHVLWGEQDLWPHVDLVSGGKWPPSPVCTVRLSVPQRSELVVGLVDPSGGARLTPLSPLQPPSDKPALQICPGPQGRSPGSVVFVCSSLVPWVGGCPVVVHGARDVGGWARLPQPRHFIRGLAAPPTVHSCPQPARVGQRGGEPGRPVLRPG